MQQISGAVAEEVRVLMARRQMTQRDVATATGLAQTTLSAKMRGATAWSVDELAAVGEALGESADVILRRALRLAGDVERPGQDSNLRPEDLGQLVMFPLSLAMSA